MRPGHILPLLLPLVTAFQPAIANADEIIVEGTRLPTPLTETGTSVSIISADDIELRGYQFAYDALASAPGVTVNQNGAFGGVATVRIRGAATDQTLVLLDGTPLGDPTAIGGGYDFSILDPADIDRIEILKGPQSTLWGSDAIGGVINIITKRAKEGLGGRIFAEGGSYSTFRGGAALTGAGDRGQFRLSASGLISEGISKADRADGNEESDEYDSYTIDGRGGFNLGRVNFDLSARYHLGDTEIDGFPPPNFSLSDTEDSSQTEQLASSFSATAPLFDGALDNQFRVNFTDVKRTGSFGGIETQDNGDRLVLRYQGTLQAGERQRIAFGGEREETSANGNDTSIDALFGLYEVKPLDALTLSAGVRYDNHSTFGDEVTARAAAALKLTDMLTLRGSWGQGFKAPTIFQLTQSFGALPANADLLPETSEAFDVGVLVSTPDQRATLDVAYFNRDTENQIIFASNFRYENLERTGAQGIEAAFSFALTSAINLNAGYAYIDATDAVTGDRQIRIPRHSADGALSYQSGPLLTAIAVRYNGDESDGPFGTDVESWVRVDLSGSYALDDNIELYARIENLFDEQYQQISGYGTPGQSAYGGVRYTF